MPDATQVPELPLAWQQLVDALNGRPTGLVGMPFERDPDGPCEHYEPTYPTVAGLGLRWREPRRWRFGNCDTDGHYLCVECPHISGRALVERGFLEGES